MYTKEQIDKRKKETAQATCHEVLCLPVSKLAVLPISAREPMIPRTRETWGWYLRTGNTFYVPN